MRELFFAAFLFSTSVAAQDGPITASQVNQVYYVDCITNYSSVGSAVDGCLADAQVAKQNYLNGLGTVLGRDSNGLVLMWLPKFLPNSRQSGI
jgi:hypothetical protein